MVARLAFLVLILQFALCSFAQIAEVEPGLLARNSPAELHVLEAEARITLEKDTIRVTLPLSAEAGPRLRVIVWLASPKDVRSGETVSILSAKRNSVSAALPWPEQTRRVREDEIGWYRVGYRVEQNEIQHSSGVLSIGAITTNLMELRLAYPKMLIQGHAISARVIAVNPVTGKALDGVKLKATLSDDEDNTSKKSFAREATTGRKGEAILTFDPLGAPGDSLTIQVEGTLAGSAGALVRASVNGDVQVMDRGSVHVEIDKPLHKPGETVRLRSLAFKDGGHAAADEPVTLTITDPDNKILVKAALKTNRFGIAAYDWRTSEQTATGDYEAKVDLDNMTGSGGEITQEVRIQRYELPEFSVTVTPDRDFYLASEQPKVEIHAGYLFGKPVAAGSVRLVRADNAEWNPKTGRYDEPKDIEANAQLDINGDATLVLKVDDDFEELKNSTWERYSDLKFRVMVTDQSTGRTEPRNFAVRLSHDAVHIYLNQIGAGTHEGEYLVSTSFADGKPAPCKVVLDWMDAQSRASRAMTVKTDRYGLAKVTLKFPSFTTGEEENRPRLRITARDAEGRVSHFDDQLWTNSSDGLWLSITHTLLRPGESIEGIVHSKPGTDVDIDVLSESGVVGHWQMRVSGTEQPFSIPGNPSFRGLITLRGYNLRGARQETRWYGGADGSTRSVLYPEDRSLIADVKGLSASYSPGAKVNAELSLRNADKGVTAGVFGVSVFDTAVEERAETEAEANDRWFGRGWWWLEGAAVGDVTRGSLNKIDTTKPINEDLDLAAEAVLLNLTSEPLAIESNDDSSVRNEYQQQMQAKEKPLGNALARAVPLNLPATFETLRQFAANAGLDTGLLVDPWNVPYKVEPSEGWHTDVLTLHSAGPDKQFGTADDFELPLVQRNVFAVPGSRLNAILNQSIQAGRPLPRSADELKALAKEAGLDLDSAEQHTLDRKGKRYLYAIDVVRRSYFIQVQTGSGETVWQSNGIDYFGGTEARLRAALEQWAATGHTFPETESQARQAFSAAGIDFSDLRDPFGRPFGLKTKREFSYARIDRVKAGDSIQGGTDEVTLLAEVIQILRTDEKKVSYGDIDEVARFAHTLSQQSGSDLKPVSVDSGLFQGNTGAIGGTVTDVTGAVIPNAAIRVDSVDSNTTVAGEAKEDGTYIVSDLPPGFYKIRVDAKGFQSFSLIDVHVSSSALTRVDVTLRVGAATETVTVSADAITSLNTASASVASIAQGVVGAKRSRVTSSNGSAIVSEQTMTPRLRHVFEETAYWAPSLETTASGRTGVSFALPDSLTTWKLHAVGSTVDGRLTEIDRTFKTFQPLFVDLDAPQVLTVGDEITLPVNLRNYTAHAITLPVTVTPGDWFKLSTPTKTQATIEANGSSPVLVGLDAKDAVDAGPLRITAANSRDGDAVEKTVKVHPDGDPRTVTASALLHGNSTNTIRFELPPNTIAGSVHASLLLYPNLGSNVVHAMRAVLQRPYGCAEQTISAAYTSLLYLELAKAASVDATEKDKAQAFLQLGYDRLLDYINPGGGLTYWGGNDTTGDAALTAYGIEFLTEAELFTSVDRSRVVAAVQWLLSQQSPDGSWKPRYGVASARDTLYIANALQRAVQEKDFATSAPNDLPMRVKQAITRAAAYSATSVLALHDPYSNALQLLLALQIGDSATQAHAREELIKSVEHGKDGAFWEFDGYSPFYGWGSGGKLETTALALAALQAAGAKADASLENDVLLYLLQSRDEYGIWMSGQATVRVLKALLPVAVRQLQGPATGSFALSVNGQPLNRAEAEALKADPRILDAPRSVDLSALVHAGTNTLEFTGTSDATVANAQISAWIYVPWAQPVAKTETTAPGKGFGLDFGYACDAANARVGQAISCTVTARRFGSQEYGMMLAEVGLPPGSDVDRASLGKLLDSGTISRYELQPDRIVFYLWSSSAEGESFNFKFVPRYSIRAKAAPAKLIDYYNPVLSAVLAPQRFSVESIPLHSAGLSTAAR
ncbi:MAG: carboxypeptidase regulatory-like domain-containing protein [Acidobacteria bacterium]|nr:carboxypeptidase regulatory-like domain-containing protein [Acidobacteriota bacterium]